MRLLLILACVLAAPISALAQVAFDACSESTMSASVATFDISHTSTNAEGVVVFCMSTGTSDKCTSVTYDSEAVPQIAAATVTKASGEGGVMEVFFLGTSVNTGTVNATVTRTNDASLVYAVVCTVQAAGDTELYETGIVTQSSDSLELVEQSVDDGSPGTNSLRFGGVIHGVQAGPVGVGANSTSGPQEDSGNQYDAVAYETTPGQGARSIGFAQAADDVVAVYFPIRQIGGAPAVTPRGPLLGVLP